VVILIPTLTYRKALHFGGLFRVGTLMFYFLIANGILFYSMAGGRNFLWLFAKKVLANAHL